MLFAFLYKAYPQIKSVDEVHNFHRIKLYDVSSVPSKLKHEGTDSSNSL